MCIIILAIFIVVAISLSIDDTYYREYNCHDKYIEKCITCRKRCKWKKMAKEYEKLIDNMEGEE